MNDQKRRAIGAKHILESKNLPEPDILARLILQNVKWTSPQRKATPPSYLDPPSLDPLSPSLTVIRPYEEGEAMSYKPGNIKFNLGFALTSISTATFAVESVKEKPWLFPFAAILILIWLMDAVKVTVDERTGMVLWMLSKQERRTGSPNRNDLMDQLTEYLKEHGYPEMTEQELERNLKTLADLRTITYDSTGRIRIRERILIEY